MSQYILTALNMQDNNNLTPKPFFIELTCVCVLNVFLSLSLPHANVWFSLSAWEERRWYNDTVTPVLHLLPFLTLCCLSADALHALAHITVTLLPAFIEKAGLKCFTDYVVT